MGDLTKLIKLNIMMLTRTMIAAALLAVYATPTLASGWGSSYETDAGSSIGVAPRRTNNRAPKRPIFRMQPTTEVRNGNPVYRMVPDEEPHSESALENSTEQSYNALENASGAMEQSNREEQAKQVDKKSRSVSKWQNAALWSTIATEVLFIGWGCFINGAAGNWFLGAGIGFGALSVILWTVCMGKYISLKCCTST